MTPKISVIVPVYNAEQYLNQCIESIINQTFTDYELVLIDDGSTDGSATICQSYARVNPNITVITQKNIGVSETRNRGMKRAKGQWITFVDSDDYVAPDYLETLFKATGNGVDWVTSGIEFVYGNGTTSQQMPTPGTFTTDNTQGLFTVTTQKLVTSPAAKLYSNALITKYGLCFEICLRYAEDRDFNAQYITRCNRCATLDYCGYYYRRDISGSLSVLKSGYSILHDIAYWKRIKYLFLDRRLNNSDTDKYLANRLFHIVNDYIATCRPHKIAMSFVELPFLKKNKQYIPAHPVVKRLLIGGHFKLLYLFYKFYKLKRK